MKQIHIDAKNNVMSNEHVSQFYDILSGKNNVHNVIFSLKVFYDKELQEIKDEFALTATILVLKKNVNDIDIMAEGAFEQIRYGIAAEQLQVLLSNSATDQNKLSIINNAVQEIENRIENYYNAE